MPLCKDFQSRQVVPICISGRTLEIDETRVRPVNSAAQDKTVHYYATATTSICSQACSAAWSAFSGSALSTGHDGWRRASAFSRRDIILRAADLFEKRRSELVQAQVDETSCLEAWGAQNVTLAVTYMREIASAVSAIRGEVPPIEKPDTFAFVFKEPVGPVLVIPPWNGALVLAARAVTSAIGAGCTVVLKASELCPLTHSMIVDIYQEAGLPSGVLNSLSADRETAAEVTEALIAHEAIRKIEFIGSAEIGRIIGSIAAKHLKPVLMELGGKCPAIVLDDADLRKAAALCAKGATLHHGQICFSTERIIVHRAIASDFKSLIIEAVSKEQGGTAVHAGMAQKAQNILKDASDKGAEFLIGDPSMNQSGNGLTPSIVLIDPSIEPSELRIVDEETFGPSASLYIVEDDTQAAQIANRSAYGLNATIHSTNMERSIKLARELEYGQVHVNSISVYTSPTGPQGGVKGSGWGRQNSKWGLEEYLKEKFITYHGKDADK